MEHNYELFRGAGATAAFEAAMIRAMLDEADIPHWGNRMRILIASADKRRAVQALAPITGRATTAAVHRKPKRHTA